MSTQLGTNEDLKNKMLSSGLTTETELHQFQPGRPNDAMYLRQVKNVT